MKTSARSKFMSWWNTNGMTVQFWLILALVGCFSVCANVISDLRSDNAISTDRLSFCQESISNKNWYQYGFPVSLPALEKPTKGIMSFWFSKVHPAVFNVMFELNGDENSNMRTNYALDSNCVCPKHRWDLMYNYNGATLDGEEMTMYGISVTELLYAQETGAHLWDAEGVVILTYTDGWGQVGGSFRGFTGTGEDVGLNGICVDPNCFIQDKFGDCVGNE